MSATLLTAMALETDHDLHRFFLGRLVSLASRQASSTDAKERAALGVATFSVFLDCLDLGLGAEAHAIIGRFRNESGETARAAA